MSLQNLENLVQRGLLRKEPAHKDEVGRLLSAADATLADSKVKGVSVASRSKVLSPKRLPKPVAD